MICTTQKGVVSKQPLQVRIDSGKEASSAKFEVVSNPVPKADRMPANRSILSGGIDVLIEFSSDSKVECIQNLRLVLQGLNRETGSEPCYIVPGKTFV